MFRLRRNIYVYLRMLGFELFVMCDFLEIKFCGCRGGLSVDFFEIRNEKRFYLVNIKVSCVNINVFYCLIFI